MHISAYEACLERVAEELMGRRKWKQYQETLMRTHLNSDQFVTSIEDNSIELKKELDEAPDTAEAALQSKDTLVLVAKLNYEENHRQEESHPEQDKTQHPNIKQQNNNEQTELLKQQEQLPIKASQNHCKNNNISIISNSSQIQPETSNITITGNNLEGAGTPPPLEPIDWKPSDKCNFCINGKLLTVNAKGELVAESGPNGSETDHRPHRLDCDSDSNGSTKLTVATNGNMPLMTGGGGSLTESNRLTLSKLLTQNMTSIDTVAAQLAAMQTLLPSLNWMQQQQHQQQQQQQQQQHQHQQQPMLQVDAITPTTSEISAAAISPSLKDSPSPSDNTGEQPLDLSSKPSPNSSISGELKSVRIKSSRATPVPSTRRTYSEEDFNNALQAILSGRSGTRKAAVQFNVPRSTLRNKICKLTSEAKRSNDPVTAEMLRLQQELERDLSADEGDGDSNASTPQPDDSVRSIATPSLLKKLCSLNNGELDAGDDDLPSSPKPAHTESSKPQTNEALPEVTPQPQIPQLDATLLLQTLLISDKNLRDLFSAVLLNGINLKDVLLAATSMSNNTAAAMEGNSLNNGNQQPPQQQDCPSFLQLFLQQQQQQQQQSAQPSVFTTGRRLPKSDTPETNSSLDPSEACEDSSMLKIPSYTPGAGTSTSMGPSSLRGSPALPYQNSNSNSNTNRNGDSPSPMLLAAAVKNQIGGNKNLSVTPPLLHSAMDAQATQSLRMCDVIANSIHRTMNEQANKDAHTASVSMLSLGSDGERNNASGSKKPTISVVKNIGGTDTSRFGAAPNLLSHNHHQTAQLHAHHLRNQEAAALAAGKGTRPKRGKYRNYDRDSLVEAVKAVQRGEMSVHRAGSYYGVPHSTLEYKVKERHLMRPRKREPKPQPGLDGTSNSSKSNANIPSGLSGLDKLKAGNSANANMKLGSASMKNNGGMGVPAFPSNAANGMKLPMFEPALAQLQYPQQLFWPHPQAAFSQLQMDFNRNSTAPRSSSPTDATGSEILKSHMQRCQDVAGGGNTSNSSNRPSPMSSPISAGQDMSRAREMYESNGAILLDGIIRKTLDRKSGDRGANACSSSGGVLLDQLLMKKIPFTNNCSNEYGSLSPSSLHASKRSASPPTLRSGSIKRERTSRSSDSDDDDTSQSGADDAYEKNNNNRRKSSHGGHKSLITQRSRMTSRDSASETDASSLKSDRHANNHLQHNNGNSSDVNGGSSAIAIKSEIPTIEAGTSILQEKLSKIKAEQQEAEENL